MKTIEKQKGFVNKDKTPLHKTFFPVTRTQHHKESLSSNNLPDKIQFKGRIISILKRKNIKGSKSEYYLFDVERKKYISSLYRVRDRFLFDDKKNSYELDILSGQIKGIPFYDYQRCIKKKSLS